MSDRSRQRRRAAGERGGFTLVELLLALLIGLVVLSGSIGFALTMWRDLAGARIREGVSRHARFVGMALERDLQHTGVSLESQPAFGSLNVTNDTLSILGVPFEPTEAPVYRLAPKSGTGTTLPAGGTCGSFCLNLKAPTAGDPVELEPGDLAMLNIEGARRLIVVTHVSPVTDSTAVTIASLASILHRPGTFAPPPGSGTNIRLKRGTTVVQKLAPVVYWLQGDSLMRAERFNDDGTYDGAPVAEGVVDWQVTLLLTDGREVDGADHTDTDADNDHDDVIGVRVRMVLQSQETDPRVNAGAPVERSYEWRFTPRNLMYERNRKK